MGDLTNTQENHILEKHAHKGIDEVFRKIRQERVKQYAKWGDQSERTSFEWFTILGEEVGELAEAILHNKFGGKAKGMMSEELLHVTAVAVQWMQSRHLEESNFDGTN